MEHLPVKLNERLMDLDKNREATLVSTYTSTDGPPEMKEKFYAELDEVISKIPSDHKLLLLGDFNACMNRDAHTWKGIIGKDGVSKSNANGHMILTKCSEHGLVISSNLYRQRNGRETSWCHPRLIYWHLIDYVIVRNKDKRDVTITQVICLSDDC